MKVKDTVFERVLNVINNEDLSLKFDERTNKKEEIKSSRFVPIKLKSEEAKRALQCQKVMLDFAHEQYKKSLGTEKESFMHKMYNDALIDYKLFKEQYEKELND